MSRWFPLESNPNVMGKYSKEMGFPIDSYCFYDVLSTEAWALEMVPKPVLAVVMLFPIKEHSEKFNIQEAKNIEDNGQVVSKDLFYVKQTIGKY